MHRTNRRHHQKPYEIRFSQNFIKDQKTANSIVELMNLKNFPVIEIGPGKGTLTRAILQKSVRVVAIEKDPALFAELKKISGKDFNKLELIEGDFLSYKLPDKGEYFVVGNIPFALSSEIIKKLAFSVNPPMASYLIVQKEFVDRVADGQSLFSLRLLPWFSAKVITGLRSEDFFPKPQVKPVLLKFEKLKEPLVSWEYRNLYFSFLNYCFMQNTPNKPKVFEKIFTPKQLKLIYLKHGIKLPKELKMIAFSEWLTIFSTFLLYGTDKVKIQVKNFAPN